MYFRVVSVSCILISFKQQLESVSSSVVAVVGAEMLLFVWVGGGGRRRHRDL